MVCCRQVVIIQRWSLAHVCLYCENMSVEKALLVPSFFLKAERKSLLSTVKNVLLLLTMIFSKKYFHFQISDKICTGNGTCTGNGICNAQTGLCDCFTGFYGLGCESK